MKEVETPGGTITYDKCASGDIAVYCNNRRIGTIVNAQGGYQFVSGPYRGLILATVREVMRLLEKS